MGTPNNEGSPAFAGLPRYPVCLSITVIVEYILAGVSASKSISERAVPGIFGSIESKGIPKNLVNGNNRASNVSRN